MIKKLLLLLVCLGAPLGLRAQVAVTGNLKDAGVANVTGQNTFIRFTLINYGSNIPRVIGSDVIVTASTDFKPDSNGNISGVVQPNNTIFPVGTYYQVCIFFAGQQFRCNNYLINGPFELSSATPISISPTAGPNQLITQIFPCLVTSPSTTWTCPHNFNDPYVEVKTYNTSSVEVLADHVDVSNPNVATITWVTAQAGFAVIVHAGSISIATNQPNAVLQNPTGSQSISNSLTATGSVTFTGPANSFTNLNKVIHVDGQTYAFNPTGIQAAINAASALGGATVIIDGNGTPISMGSTGLTLPSKVCLRGNGMESTILQWSGNVNAIAGTSVVGSCVTDMHLDFTGASNSSAGIRIASSDAAVSEFNTFDNLHITFVIPSSGSPTSEGIFVTGSGPAGTDTILNTFRNITIDNANQMIFCQRCEGNFWQVRGQNLGTSAGQALVSLSNSTNEIMDLRIESGSSNFINAFCFSDDATSQNNLVRMVCDANLAGVTALLDNGTYNLFDVTTIGSPTLGTVAATSQYRYTSSYTATQNLKTGNLLLGGTLTLGSGTFVPSAAGANDLGTAALPMGNLWLGTAATNNFKFQPAATSAARVINISDPGAPTSLGLSYNTTSGYTQSKRAVAGCTTGSAAGNSCGTDITVTWGVAFPDANYSVACTGSTPTNVPSAPFVVSASKLAGSVHINYFAITAAAASYATIDCLAQHD